MKGLTKETIINIIIFTNHISISTVNSDTINSDLSVVTSTKTLPSDDDDDDDDDGDDGDDNDDGDDVDGDDNGGDTNNNNNNDDDDDDTRSSKVPL